MNQTVVHFIVAGGQPQTVVMAEGCPFMIGDIVDIANEVTGPVVGRVDGRTWTRNNEVTLTLNSAT